MNNVYDLKNYSTEQRSSNKKSRLTSLQQQRDEVCFAMVEAMGSEYKRLSKELEAIEEQIQVLEYEVF